MFLTLAGGELAPPHENWMMPSTAGLGEAADGGDHVWEDVQLMAG
jgi:hypothetical protein